MKINKELGYWIFPIFLVTVLLVAASAFKRIENRQEQLVFFGEADRAYKLSLEMLNMPGCITDHQGNIIVWPYQSEKLLGWKENEILYKNINLIVSTQEILGRSLDSFKYSEIPEYGVVKSLQQKIVKKDGTSILIDLRLRLDKNRKNEIITIITFQPLENT